MVAGVGAEAQREVVLWTSPRNDYSAISQLWPSALKEKESHSCKKNNKSAFPGKGPFKLGNHFHMARTTKHFYVFVLIKEKMTYLLETKLTKWFLITVSFCSAFSILRCTCLSCKSVSRLSEMWKVWPLLLLLKVTKEFLTLNFIAGLSL